MSDETKPGLLSRIGGWFRPRPGLPVLRELPVRPDDFAMPTANPPAPQTKGSLLRPWAKRDAAIDNLQTGIAAMGDLLGSIKTHLDRQSDRHDQIMNVLGDIPQTLASIPESAKVHGETLKAIHQQIAGQSEHQRTLSDILKQIGHFTQDNTKVLGGLTDRIDLVADSNRQVHDNLSHVGNAMQAVTRSSNESTVVLQHIREALSARQGEMERALRSQNQRLTLMLSISLCIAALALVGVVILGVFMATTNKPAPIPAASPATQPAAGAVAR